MFPQKILSIFFSRKKSHEFSFCEKFCLENENICENRITRIFLFSQKTIIRFRGNPNLGESFFILFIKIKIRLVPSTCGCTPIKLLKVAFPRNENVKKLQIGFSLKTYRYTCRLIVLSESAGSEPAPHQMICHKENMIQIFFNTLSKV